MFGNIITKIKELFKKMGLIKGIAKVTDHPRIGEQEEMYNKIHIWKELYKGYHEPFHTVHYSTLEGHRKRTMNTLHMGKVAASEMASLIYNEKCNISISDGGVNDFINGWHGYQTIHREPEHTAATDHANIHTGR